MFSTIAVSMFDSSEGAGSYLTIHDFNRYVYSSFDGDVYHIVF